MVLQLFLLGLIIILTLIYYTGKHNENYWKKRGVKFYDKNKLMGPFWEFLTQDRALFQILHDLYKMYPDEPAIGFGAFTTPSLYVKDKTNVQYVMQSPSFIDRGISYNHGDLLADNMVFMSGIRWKLMRQKMTPLFTSSKLKNMYYIMDKSAQDFVEYLRKNEGKSNITFDTLTTFCCAAICGAVFGIHTESTFDSPFMEIGRGGFKATWWSNIRFSILNVSPWLFKELNLRLFKLEYEKFFIGAMKKIFREREKEGIKRHDFVDLCLSIQKTGAIKHDESGYTMEPTDELLAAQGFFFFSAGVEPAAAGLFGALIEIGRRPEIQKKVQSEIDVIFEKYNGNLNYEAVMEMEYLDKVLSESLRVHPPVGFLSRRCLEDSVLPVGNIKIDKGTRILTPIFEYHHDPQYYNDPEVFDPERFSEDAKQTLGVTYQPFGFGSRICIGGRYARFQVKSGLSHILRNFDLRTNINKGGIKYGKDQVQVRIKNVDIEFKQRINN